MVRGPIREDESRRGSLALPILVDGIDRSRGSRPVRRRLVTDEPVGFLERIEIIDVVGAIVKIVEKIVINIDVGRFIRSPVRRARLPLGRLVENEGPSPGRQGPITARSVVRTVRCMIPASIIDGMPALGRLTFGG
jgi:hypothetical protein